MIARGTIRTSVELRLVSVIGDLDGFDADPDTPERFWPVAFGSNTAKRSTRWVAIGTPDGPLNPDGIATGHGPSRDTWTISCTIAAQDIDDGPTAKATVESAVNTIADYLAAHGRLDMNPGPESVEVTDLDGPHFVADPGKAPMAWINFDIACTATISRNQP